MLMASVAPDGKPHVPREWISKLMNPDLYEKCTDEVFLYVCSYHNKLTLIKNFQIRFWIVDGKIRFFNSILHVEIKKI